MSTKIRLQKYGKEQKETRKKQELYKKNMISMIKVLTNVKNASIFAA